MTRLQRHYSATMQLPSKFVTTVTIGTCVYMQRLEYVLYKCQDTCILHIRCQRTYLGYRLSCDNGESRISAAIVGTEGRVEAIGYSIIDVYELAGNGLPGMWSQTAFLPSKQTYSLIRSCINSV